MTARHVVLRALGLGSFVAACAAAVWWHERLRPEHPRLVYLTGWCLLGLMLYLTAYNLRKKLAFLPLVSSRLWLQAHIWLGLFTGLVFLLHLQSRWPAGVFENLLALLFVGVTVSGLLGWGLSRTLPARLTAVGGEVPFEHIPVIRRSLRERAEGLVVGGIAEARAATLADFYTARLAGFFAAPANFRAHLFASRRPLNHLLEQLVEVKRFLGPEEKRRLDELALLVRQKDATDLHRTTQLLLKGWLFVHIPLTYGLLLFSFVHVVLVYAYSGGAR